MMATRMKKRERVARTMATTTKRATAMVMGETVMELATRASKGNEGKRRQ